MAIINKTPAWEEVPELSTSTIARGGPGGPMNQQAEALDARTRMLHNYALEALRRSYAEAGYNLVDGSFEKGGILASKDNVLLHEKTGKAYSWMGEYPDGGYIVENESDPVLISGFIARHHEQLRGISASGISLSRLMHLQNPLETGLELHREYGVELVIDCDCEYSTMVIKSGDSIRCVGWPTLKKKNNAVPQISPTQAPERPVGYLDKYDVNAFFVVYHEPNKVTERVRIAGGVKFYCDNNITLEKYAHIPRLAFSHITDIRMDSAYTSSSIDAVCFKYEYANTIGDIHVLNSGMGRYGFLWEDLYNGIYYATGTSGNIYGLHTVNFRKPFRLKNHNYSEMRVCGGEAVGIKDELSADLPVVFDIEDSVVTLHSPSTEHLYGSFIKVTRTNTISGCSAVINTPQANTTIYGSKDNLNCKLFDVDGVGASCVVNGGFMTPAASGYNLKFGGAKNDSMLQLNSVDLTYLTNSIKNDTENYTGLHEFNCMQSKYMMKLWGIDGDKTVSGQMPFSTTEYDPFGIRSGTAGSQATVRRSGYYAVNGAVRTSDAAGYLSIFIKGVERARTYFDNVSGQTGEQTSTFVNFEGRINGGENVELRITLTSGSYKGNNWYDCKFTVEIK